MSKIALAASVFLVLTRTDNFAQTLKEQLITKQGQSIEKLRSDWRAREIRISKLNQSQSKGCVIAPPVRCVGGEFLDPLPAAIGPWISAVRARFRGNLLRFTWAPETSVYQARSVLDTIQRAATLFQPLTCEEGRCEVAVQVVNEPGDQALAICSALDPRGQNIPSGAVFDPRLKSRLGPPINCQVVVVSRQGQWWIEAIDGVTPPALARMIGIYTLEVKGLPRSAMMTSLDRALASSPLTMPDRSMKRDRLWAIAPRRFSKVISGEWFEWAQVLIELDEEYRVKLYLDLLVNKQNTEEPSNWHLPTEQQQEEYRRAIITAITRELANVCINPVWSGSKVLRCAQLATSNGMVAIPEGASREDGREIKLDPRITKR
jgi:hypothetical protein